MDARAALVVLAFLGVGGAAYFALRPRLALASSSAPAHPLPAPDNAPVAAAAHEGGGAGAMQTAAADMTPEQIQKVGEIQTAGQVAKLLSAAPAPNLATKAANQANAMRAMAEVAPTEHAKALAERAAKAADNMARMLNFFGKAQPAEVVFE